VKDAHTRPTLFRNSHVNKRRDQLEGRIQERYGIAKDRVREDVGT
jgi:uncharacterized protein YjbJ (UPF0337 family)